MQKANQPVDPVLQRNGYFAHPKNLLLAMISDERQYIRELGLRRILKARLEKVIHCVRSMFESLT